MKIEIGAYAAKTKLPELLRGVEHGRSYTITHRGKPVADLIPAEGQKHADATAAANEMMHFMRDAPIRGVDIRTLIEEGRA